MPGRARWAALAITCVLLAAFALRAAQSDGSLERVRQAGVLRVGMEASYPPFAMTDGQGQFSGFDVDLAQAIAGRLGVQMEIRNLAYDTLYDALASGFVDVVISALPYERERTRDVMYSSPYVDVGLIIVMPDGPAKSISRVQDLSEHVIAAEQGGMAELEVQRLAGLYRVRPLLVADPTLAVEAMLGGQADAAIVDTITAYPYIQWGGAVAVGSPLVPEPYAIAASIRDRSLMQAVERILATLRYEGFLESLKERWFAATTRPYSSP